MTKINDFKIGFKLNFLLGGSVILILAILGWYLFYSQSEKVMPRQQFFRK